MKVSELKEGMLVKPSAGWEVVSCDWPAYREDVQPDVLVKLEGSIGATVSHVMKRKARKDILMFIGTTQDDFQWGGVKKHHRFLWNGKGIIMTGYDMRHMEPVEVSCDE